MRKLLLAGAAILGLCASAQAYEVIKVCNKYVGDAPRFVSIDFRSVNNGATLHQGFTFLGSGLTQGTCEYLALDTPLTGLVTVTADTIYDGMTSGRAVAVYPPVNVTTEQSFKFWQSPYAGSKVIDLAVNQGSNIPATVPAPVSPAVPNNDD